MRVSIVIPVRDEELTIRALLASLFDQTCPPDEVVITDGGSRDRTVEIIQEHTKKDTFIKLIRTNGTFPGEGRNLGVQAASHGVIAFTDAGIRLDKRWLQKLREPLEIDPSVDVVYGTYEPIMDSFFKECAALAYVPATTKRDEGRIRIPFIASSLMKRFVWEAVGGFPPFRAAEDLIFMEAIEKKKFKIAYMPEAVAYWQIPGDWTRTFWRFAKYSRHNLIAKRARYWHYGVARLYGAGAIFLALALVHSPAWALLPAVGLIGRTIRTAYRKRCAFAFRDVFRPKRLLYLLGLLVVMDAATAWGFCVWVWGDRLFRTSP